MRKVTDFIERISKEYSYKPLPPDKSKLAREFYTKNLPVLYDDEPVFTPSGEVLAECFHRIVIGDYGAYVEFTPAGLVDLIVPRGQEFRLRDDFKGKYIWYTTPQHDCKIYYQLRRVRYADYIPGKYYISVYEIVQRFD